MANVGNVEKNWILLLNSGYHSSVNTSIFLSGSRNTAAFPPHSCSLGSVMKLTPFSFNVLDSSSKAYSKTLRKENTKSLGRERSYTRETGEGETFVENKVFVLALVVYGVSLTLLHVQQKLYVRSYRCISITPLLDRKNVRNGH